MTIPDPEPTLAWPLVLLQSPPGAIASDNVIEEPTQVLDGPVTIPAPVVDGTILNALVVETEPQALVIVYITVSAPGVVASTTPTEDIAPSPLLRLHVPPAV